MDYPAPLVRARFLRRDNRFRATVLLDGQKVAAHVPNSGRLGELFIPGTPVYLLPQPRLDRRTPFDLVLVRRGTNLVSVDARMPNRLFAESLREGRLPEFSDNTQVRREVRRGASRLDFLLVESTGERCWVETKSCTLVEDGVALFPDAPTTRGQRHLYELAQAVSAGDQATVAFVIQRSDAYVFSPHPQADPEFKRWLRAADRAGVAIRAYVCQVDLGGIRMTSPVSVVI